jgi:hypothetical protein
VPVALGDIRPCAGKLNNVEPDHGQAPRTHPLDYAAPQSARHESSGVKIVASGCLLVGIGAIGIGAAFIYLTTGAQDVPWAFPFGAIALGILICIFAVLLRRH